MDPTRVPVMGTTGRTPSGATNVYILGDRQALLIDPANRNDELDAAVAGADIDHLAFTHHHGDHTGAAVEYATDTGATVWARAGRVEEFENATGLTPDRTFVGGTTIPVGDGSVRVIETPGHAVEHVAFATPDWMVTGDLAVEPGTVVVGHPEGDMRAYLSSLRRLWAREPSTLYPGHGSVIDDPRVTLERLLAHRRTREHRILTAIKEGARTVEAVTDSAYDKDISGVRGLAEATVRAHLEKLVAEGKVDWQDQDVRPRS